MQVKVARTLEPRRDDRLVQCCAASADNNIQTNELIVILDKDLI